jgi:hypothetical protein
MEVRSNRPAIDSGLVKFGVTPGGRGAAITTSVVPFIAVPVVGVAIPEATKLAELKLKLIETE